MEAITDERFDINGTYTDPEDDLEKNLLTVISTILLKVQSVILQALRSSLS